MSRVTAGTVGLIVALMACLLCLLIYISPKTVHISEPSIKTSLSGKVDQLTDALVNLKEQALQISGIKAAPNPIMDPLRTAGKVNLPTKDEIQLMSADAVFKTYHSYLDNTDIVCQRKIRMGKIGDGGWEVCDDEAYRPRSPCLIYSFGINNDFSFDDDMARVYQCQVFSFDPSMKTKTYQRTPRDKFLQIGIGGENKVLPKGWTLQTLQRSKEMLNHTGKVIDVLKMDVESSEWGSLPQIIQSGELRLVRQLLVEYHGLDVGPKRLEILKDIYDAGFRKFYVHKNFHCGKKHNKFPVVRTSCYEVHYVNINIPE